MSMKDYCLKIVAIGEVAVVGAGVGMALIGATEIATAIAAQQWLQEARYYIDYVPLVGGAVGAIMGGMRIARRRRWAAAEMVGMSDPVIARGKAKLEGTLEASTHLHDALKERLQNSDKQGEIELYYELLSSGRSVGEILNTVNLTQSKSERDDSAKLEQPQSDLDNAANVVCEAALANVMETKVLSTPGVLMAHDEESRRTGEPQATKDRWLNGVGSDDRKHLSKNMPRFDLDIIKSSGANTSIIHERAANSNNLERFRRDKLPSITKRVAFLVFYMAAISSLLIAGFSVMRASRNDEPTITSMLSDVPSQIGAIAIPHPIAARSEAAMGFLTPQKSVSGSPQKIEAGVQETDSAIRREVEVSQQSAANQLGRTQRSADLATAPSNPAHEPTTLVIQSPSTPPTGSVDTAVHSNTGQATPKNGDKGTAIVPTGIASATSLLRAHAVRRHQASTPRQYAAWRRRIRRPASVYYGLSQGSYYSSFGRGYSYGGPAPHSDTGS
jgi:hypothetical protein